MDIHQFTVNIFQENATVVSGKGAGCILIDPGCYTDAEIKSVEDFISARGFKPEAILLTHGHPDHIFAVKHFQDLYSVPVYISPMEEDVLLYSGRLSEGLGLRKADTSFTRTDISDGDVIEAAGFRFKVITTPGHTPGGVCYLEDEEKVMFTGDTLFAGTIGRTDLKYGEYDDEIVSIMEKLIILDGDIEIRPGHGPSSTIGRERTTNPMLEPFNEKEELDG